MQKAIRVRRSLASFPYVMAASAVGALATFFLDPKNGAVRRAWVVQKLLHSQRVLEKKTERQARHVKNRALGAKHKAHKLVERVVPQANA